MPATVGTPEDRFYRRQRDSIRAPAAIAAQQQRFVINPTTGACQSILGNLQYDHAGNATGLGSVWGIADLNAGGNWVREGFKPYYLAYDSGGTTVTTGGVNINLGGKTASGYGCTMASGANLTVPIAGLYQVDYSVGVASAALSSAGVGKNNTTTILFNDPATGGSQFGIAGAGMVILAAGDYLNLTAQTWTGTVATNPGASVTFLHVCYLGSA